MIPAQFVFLDRLPLNPNGKVDFRGLPVPAGIPLERELVGPRNPVEARLVKIWEEVLGIDSVSIYDNFFELGGHSLKAMQAASRIYEEMNTMIELKNIFVEPTVAALSSLIESIAWLNRSSEEPRREFITL